MRWLLFSNELSSIVKHCSDVLEIAGQTVLHYHHHGIPSRQPVTEQVDQHKPDRIIVFDNEKLPEATFSLSRALYESIVIPTFVGQVNLHMYTPIPVLVITYTGDHQNDANTTDSALSLSSVQSITDDLLKLYPNTIYARVYTPISDEDLNEKVLVEYLSSLWKNNADQPHHLSILSDILPILLALLHDNQAYGRIEVCNKGTISLNRLKALVSNPSKMEESSLALMDSDDVAARFEKLTKEMISLETRHLYQICFSVPCISTSLRQYLHQKSINFNSDAPRTLLVTGGCGFIGSTFINHWLKTYPEDQIINIDRLDPVANTRNIENPTSSKYTLIVADITNKDIVLHLMKQYNITHIVHFAVQTHLDPSFGNSITFTESNVFGTHSVLEASRTYGQIVKFIHISTDEVYGEVPSDVLHESKVLNPVNPYAATIAAAEFLVRSYGDSFKLNYCIVRLSNVYGPRQHWEKVIPTFINNLLNEKTLTIHGDGQQKRAYIYVDDVVNAIDIIFRKGKFKMVYNIGANSQLSVIDVARRLLEKIHPNKCLEDVITFGKGRPFSEKRYSSTTNGVLKSLGWQPSVSIDEGFDRTIQWCRDNADYWEQ